MENKYMFKYDAYELINSTGGLSNGQLPSESKVSQEIRYKLKKMEVVVNSSFYPYYLLKKTAKLFLVLLFLHAVFWFVYYAKQIKANQKLDKSVKKAIETGKPLNKYVSIGNGLSLACNQTEDSVYISYQCFIESLEKRRRRRHKSEPNDDTPAVEEMKVEKEVKQDESDSTEVEAPKESDSTESGEQEASDSTEHEEHIESQVSEGDIEEIKQKQEQKSRLVKLDTKRRDIMPRTVNTQKMQEPQPNPPYSAPLPKQDNSYQQYQQQYDPRQYQQIQPNQAHHKRRYRHPAHIPQTATKPKEHVISLNQDDLYGNTHYANQSNQNPSYNYPNYHRQRGSYQENQYNNEEQSYYNRLLQETNSDSDLAQEQPKYNKKQRNLHGIPILIDNKFYMIYNLQTKNYHFTMFILFFCLSGAFFILEFLACYLKTKLDNRLTKLFEHLIYLENKTRSAVKIVMVDDFYIIELHIGGVVDFSEKDLSYKKDKDGYLNKSDFDMANMSNDQLLK